ncbi:kinesin motor domain containing protein [Stylonychia lemnae]|uniref:Kinesin-like protein n=1 Tax=Stylonychia lemnae TaxID=5949 RepID=A0A078AUU0_STYLE|nr:kinesin motor domain containing protein [Stylonychia lemnae]|eukprot:CDW85964.1 kinesin motor domain containing protein [Stylonychia lemnae]
MKKKVNQQQSPQQHSQQQQPPPNQLKILKPIINPQQQTLNSQTPGKDKNNIKKSVLIQEPVDQNVQSVNEKEQTQGVKKDEKIRVAIRVRPKLRSENIKDSVVECTVSENKIRVSDLTHIVESKYDQLFDMPSTQRDVYDFITSTIQGVFDGYNSTIFAYGQTGSGKTYTMFGPSWEENIIFNKKQQNALKVRNQLIDQQAIIVDKNQEGVIPRSIREIFNLMKSNDKASQDKTNHTIYCSFIQIYNEKIYDLLQDIETKKPLKTEKDCFALLRRGELNRITRQTKKNILSSRSHSIFQLLIESDKPDSRGFLKKAKLNLCDLAGSEKIHGLEDMQNAVHINELKTINLSLTNLGKVIQALSKESKMMKKNQNLFTPRGHADYFQKVHIPYRDSQLTRILQDSLGGNTRTVLIATVSPIIDNIEETISTLKFADRAKQVMATIRANEINAADDALVQKLQKEVQTLREVLNLRRKGVTNDIQRELLVLKEENLKLKEMAQNADMVERLKLENKLMKLELQKMKEPGGSDYGSNTQHFNTLGGSSELTNHTSNSFVGTIRRSNQSDPFLEFQESDPTVNSKASSFKMKGGAEHIIIEERKQEVKSLQGSLQKNGRCPICTLLPPCNHYKNQRHANTQSMPSLNLKAVKDNPYGLIQDQKKKNTDRYELGSYSPKNTFSVERKESNSTLQIGFNNNNILNSSDSAQKLSGPSFFPQLVSGMTHNQNLQDYGSDHFTSISQRLERNNSFRRKNNRNAYLSNSLVPQTERAELTDENNFLEVRIRGKNNTFAKKKASAFVTLDEQSKIQEKRKEQIKQSERLKQLQIFEKDRETKIKNDFQQELKKIEDQYTQNALQSARKRI